MKKETGQDNADTHDDRADLDDETGHQVNDNHHLDAGNGDGGGHTKPGAHAAGAALISEIRERYKLRTDFHRPEKRLTLQIKALCRRIARGTHCGGEKCGAKLCAPDMAEAGVLYNIIDKGNGAARDDLLATTACYELAESRMIVQRHRLALDKLLRSLAMKLPVWEWAEQIPGFGALGLAILVGEAGDLSKYANPGKLWKRMGCGMVEEEDGTWGRQRRVRGAAALKHGYAPSRRSALYTIGDSLLKMNFDHSTDPKTPGYYRELYLKQKAYYAENRVETKGDNAGKPWSKGHCHNAAQRYMEKRLLRELWKAWRGES